MFLIILFRKNYENPKFLSVYGPRKKPVGKYDLYENKTKTISMQIGWAVFATFFICFEANVSKYGSYSLHIRMFHLPSYSLQNVDANTHTNI
jgi:hypothetical protein